MPEAIPANGKDKKGGEQRVSATTFQNMKAPDDGFAVS